MDTLVESSSAIGSARSILFRTGRGLGDAVLCEPLVRRLKAFVPTAQVTVMLPASCADIHRLGFAGDNFAPWCEPEDLEGLSVAYDWIIDADPGQYIHPYRTTNACGGHLIRLFAHYRPEALRTTAYERMAEGLAKIGPNAVYDAPALRTTPDILNDAAKALAALELDPGVPIITFHPGSNAAYSHKRWMAEGFAEVADELGRRVRANIVAVGSGPERELLEAIRSAMPTRYPLKTAVDWPLCDIAALLTRSALLIGNDSGIGHLAAALGRPVVTIAGPTYPHFWAPMTDRALVVDTRGCCYKPNECGVYCLKSITPCEVIGAAEALLHATISSATAAVLDPIRLAPDLEIFVDGEDHMTLCSARYNMPLRIDRGKDYVLGFIRTVGSTGSTKAVQSAVGDADILLEQCLRYSIVQHGTKEEPDYICPQKMTMTQHPRQ